MNSKKDKSINRIIEIILEDLGKINPRAGRGYGTGQSAVTKSTKQSLGYVEEKAPKEKKANQKVKISKAFIKKDATQT
tara:strand:- start:17 stop:250 length:234 start_codon:yes stop_codon:yes gene_type:complete